MPISDASYNAFARCLVERFAERAVASDSNSVRLVDARPSDHVLAGFLTPAARDVDDAPDDDLPRDSAYQQSSIGIEWLLPRTLGRTGDSLRIELGFSVYVRRLPRFDELRHLTWSVDRRATQPTPEQAALPMVWTREGPFSIATSIDVSELIANRVLSVSLQGQAAEAFAQIDVSQAYPGQRALKLLRGDVESLEHYVAWISRQPASSLPPHSWLPQVDIRAIPIPTSKDLLRVALRFVNKSYAPAQPSQLDFVDPNLYAAQIAATVPLACHRHSVFNELPSSYRYERRVWAVGINAQVLAKPVGPDLHLQTQTIATHETARLVPRSVPGVDLTFDGLQRDPVPLLSLISKDMARYAREDWANKLAVLAGAEREEADLDSNVFTDEWRRFDRGVQLLADTRYPDIRRAFSLMNEAMKAATRHSTWRLFQIVFLVSLIPELAGRIYPALAVEDAGKVDILWFAAGGGKTEAFLGLVLWQAFADRLRGKMFGATAVVRFPLRLLGFQQFQRIGRAIAQAELIRNREQLGGARFSLGFFVGNQVTPNRIDDELHRRFASGDIDPTYQRVLQCPFCDAPVKLAFDASLGLLEHRCSSQACSGGRHRLPIYIVDTDIYRFVPTIIVSTVDKFALLGQNHRFANIFGRIDLLCHRHGASFAGSTKGCAAAADRSKADCEGKPVFRGPFLDLAPSLLVQDEMHLLSEDLGAFDAHYETAISELTRSLGCTPWKVVGATATIEDYARHARHLYQLEARRFPAPGPEADSSFYYHPAQDRIGRIFVGLVGVGKKHTPIVSRALSFVYLEIEKARELAVDPAQFYRRYPIGAQVSTADLIELVFRYEIALTYVLTRKGSDQVSEAIESRVRKEIEEASKAALNVRTFNSGVDMVAMIETMNGIQRASADTDPGERVRGVVATNIIGHGVDVDRFNTMLFAGFTRMVAEYIQASARVGRTFPGISILVVTPQSERDRSVFDRFESFHRYLDRLVDPSAITRWSEPALQRTVPGILCGYIFGVGSLAVGTPLSTVEQVQKAISDLDPPCLRESTVVAWMQRAYGVDQAPGRDKYATDLARVIKSKLATITNAAPAPGIPWGRLLGKHLGAMKSLRDVDEPADIVVSLPNQVDALRRLLNG